MGGIIGNSMRSIRKSKGMTQKDLGIQCGIAEQTISQYERGSRNPKKETMDKIAKALGITVHELENGKKIEGSLDQQYLEKLGYKLSMEQAGICYTLSHSGYQARFTQEEFTVFNDNIRQYINACFSQKVLEQSSKDAIGTTSKA